MELNVRERITLVGIMPSLIPEQGSRHFYAMIDKLAVDLSLTEKEVKEIELKQEGEEFADKTGKKEVVPQGMMRWRDDKEVIKDVRIPDVLQKLIVKNFQQMDKRGQLTANMIPLFDRFVDENSWYKEGEDDGKE